MISEDHSAIRLNPFFLEGKKGAVFCLHYLPESKSSEILLFLPAFAEESNRSRVMVALQVRQLAALGIGSLLLDFYGTGDSAGEFTETNWSQWLEDANIAIEWLRSQGYRNISLWGMRLGALVTAELANQSPNSFRRLLLWQPIVSGDKYLTQLLRIRLSFMLERGGIKETTQQLLAELKEGHQVEVAGYEISPILAKELLGKSLQDFNKLNGLPVDWFEWVFDDSVGLPPGSLKVIDNWKQEGINIETHSFTGATFWQAHERELNPLLISLTTALFE